jgi:hypothetical protein
LPDIAVHGCITKAPDGGEVTGPYPSDDQSARPLNGEIGRWQVDLLRRNETYGALASAQSTLAMVEAALACVQLRLPRVQRYLLLLEVASTLGVDAAGCRYAAPCQVARLPIERHPDEGCAGDERAQTAQDHADHDVPPVSAPRAEFLYSWERR